MIGSLVELKGSLLAVLFFASVLATAAAVAAGDWQAIERVQPYLVKGTNGPELYASIGHSGPVVGNNIRAMAHTNFKLTWTRKYERRENACVLASARPKLIITYTLPKTANSLPEPVRTRWETFHAGLAAHEKVHGDFIKDLVKGIEQQTIGLTEPNDPGCKRIKTEMNRRLLELSNEQQRRSREFDQVEMSDGGNIQRLVLSLLNGGLDGQ